MCVGAREYCGHKLADDMKKNQRLPEAIVTPTTKDDGGDYFCTLLIINAVSENLSS